MFSTKNYSPSGKIANCQIIADSSSIRYMSYNTVIAFESKCKADNGLTYISDKKWSVTTGRHRNYVKSCCRSFKVVSHAEFVILYEKTFKDTYVSNY